MLKVARLTTMDSRAVGRERGGGEVCRVQAKWEDKRREDIGRGSGSTGDRVIVRVTGSRTGCWSRRGGCQRGRKGNARRARGDCWQRVRCVRRVQCASRPRGCVRAYKPPARRELLRRAEGIYGSPSGVHARKRDLATSEQLSWAAAAAGRPAGQGELLLREKVGWKEEAAAAYL